MGTVNFNWNKCIKKYSPSERREIIKACEKLKNIVFDRKIALENEEYNYLNVNHPFVQNIGP